MNFRAIADANVELASGTTLLSGANAQGKTSVLEAIGFLATGRSFRTSRDRECIAWNAPDGERWAAVEGDFDAGPTRHTTRLVIEPKGKSVWVDGKALRTLSELWGLLRAVFFSPADLQIVQGPPSLRRNVMDTLLAQTNSSYLRILTAANRALQSRNRLLRDRLSPQNRQFDAVEAALAEHAAHVIKERSLLAERLSSLVSEPMTLLTEGGESLRMVYEPGFPAAAGLPPEFVSSSGITELQDRLRARLSNHRQADADRFNTAEGHHRDDLRFEINGNDARTYASQGQTRCSVVALRLAELEVLSEKPDRKPLLLLDDILGELDIQRSRQFLHLVREKNVQTVITATDAAAVETNLEVHRHYCATAGSILERIDKAS